ncbi:aspartic peptidase domain-containing protein [Xylaria nigripes]|nr:aspartic peptidase domain-containing protein [Xylaria nigripes]
MWSHKCRRACHPVVLMLLICFALNTLVSADCLPYPIAVPIHNVTLSNGNTARGAELAIGHPPQSLAFLPQWPLNNTLVYGTNGYCTNTNMSESACITWRGGQYALLSSDTRRQPLNPNPIDTAPYPETTTYTDVLKVNDNVTIKDFAIGVPLSDWLQQGYHPRMAIGLGSNSTFLSSLQAGKQIASRVWSMFYGLVGANPNAQLDGTLVFGGYDRAKVSGRGYKQKLQSDPSCSSQMLVKIEDVILHFPNGTDASIVGQAKTGGFSACIVPDYPGLMTLTDDPYFQLFENLTDTILIDRNLGQEYYTMLYSIGSTPYLGDLSINIQNGPSIRIPNNQLVVPERYVDDSTGQLTTDDSRSNLVINSLNTVNKHDLSQLGRLFLSSAYVMVNQDSGEFTLWTANPTTLEDLVGVDSTGKEVTTFCSSSTNSTDTSTANASLPAGGIAGIVVGAVAAVGLVVSALLWRHNRNKARARGQLLPQSASQIPESPSMQFGYVAANQDMSKWDGPGELHGQGISYPTPELLGRETSNRTEPVAPPTVQLFELPS